MADMALYPLNEQYALMLENVADGNWIGHVGYRQSHRELVAYLHVRHEDFAEPEFDPAAYSRESREVSVDSAQAGFFDEKAYATAVVERFEEFYESVFNLTTSKELFGAVEFGVVSTYGAGAASC